MLEQQFDEPPFAGSELSMNAAARQTMQERHGLLGKKFFKLVGRHISLVMSDR